MLTVPAIEVGDSLQMLLIRDLGVKRCDGVFEQSRHWCVGFTKAATLALQKQM